MRDRATNDIKIVLAAVSKPSSADFATSSAPKDFFSFGRQTLPAKAQDELSRYLLVPVDYPLSQVKNFEGLNQLFLKHNTSVPSSASVKRLFNIANEKFDEKNGFACLTQHRDATLDEFKQGTPLSCDNAFRNFFPH